jgi:hypothetical protein
MSVAAAIVCILQVLMLMLLSVHDGSLVLLLYV